MILKQNTTVKEALTRTEETSRSIVHMGHAQHRHLGTTERLIPEPGCSPRSVGLQKVMSYVRDFKLSKAWRVLAFKKPTSGKCPGMRLLWKEKACTEGLPTEKR